MRRRHGRHAKSLRTGRGTAAAAAWIVRGPVSCESRARWSRLAATPRHAESPRTRRGAAAAAAWIVRGPVDVANRAQVFEPRALDELLPDWRDDEDAPLKTKVKDDTFIFLTGETGGVGLPCPPSLHNDGSLPVRETGRGDAAAASWIVRRPLAATPAG